MIFMDFVVRLPSETLEQIDEAIERIHPALTDRQEFVESAIEYVLQGLREESQALRISLED